MKVCKSDDGSGYDKYTWSVTSGRLSLKGSCEFRATRRTKIRQAKKTIRRVEAMWPIVHEEFRDIWNDRHSDLQRIEALSRRITELEARPPCES